MLAMISGCQKTGHHSFLHMGLHSCRLVRMPMLSRVHYKIKNIRWILCCGWLVQYDVTLKSIDNVTKPVSYL